MNLKHRFLNELENLEQNQFFCNQKISKENRILIIGTFNPNDESCKKENQAIWFYGRTQNWFWKYLPAALNKESLLNEAGLDLNACKEFCKENKIVIVDLLKGINDCEQLDGFNDEKLNERILSDIQNADVFRFEDAFRGVTFEKVIYTRKGWNSVVDKNIEKLIKIKNLVNEVLIKNQLIKDSSQIKYCPAPWQKRQSTKQQWIAAIND